MKKIWLGISVLFVVFLGWVITQADRGSLPIFITQLYAYPEGDKAYPEGDKVGHFILFGCAAFLINMALAGRTMPVRHFRIYLGSAGVMLATALEEFSQMFFPSRNSSMADLAASLLGIMVIGTLLPWVLIRKKPHIRDTG